MLFLPPRNYRTIHMLIVDIGNAHGSPHFMRYSGSQEHVFNAISFNNVIGDRVGNFASRTRL